MAHTEKCCACAARFIGHGYSTKPDHPLEIPNTSTRSTTSSKPSAPQKAYFSGESLGGCVTARYAIEHPDQVDKIAPLNTMGGTMANPTVAAEAGQGGAPVDDLVEQRAQGGLLAVGRVEPGESLK